MEFVDVALIECFRLMDKTTVCALSDLEASGNRASPLQVATAGLDSRELPPIG